MSQHVYYTSARGELQFMFTLYAIPTSVARTLILYSRVWSWRPIISAPCPTTPTTASAPGTAAPAHTLGIDNPVSRAAFEYTADSITTEVEFFDGSFFATAWAWDMGDGHTSTARHPVHAYAQAGLYTVCLTASNFTGSHTVCETVRVEKSSTPAGEAQPSRVELRIFPPAHPDVPANLFAEGLPAAEVAGTVRDALGRIVRRFCPGSKWSPPAGIGCAGTAGRGVFCGIGFGKRRSFGQREAGGRAALRAMFCGTLFR